MRYIKDIVILKKYNIFLFTICYSLFILLFSLIPNTFWNYAWNYYQFLPKFWILFPFIGIIFLFLLKKIFNNEITHIKLSIFIASIILCSCFILFKTKFHCFGGDIPIHTLDSSKLLIGDFIPTKYKSPDIYGPYLVSVIFKLCQSFSIFSKTEIMPIILATSIHSILFGFISIITLGILLRKRLDIFLIIITSPFIFNFFGNIDSYAFELYLSFIEFILILKLWNKQNLKFIDFLIPTFFLGFCIWIHPLMAFLGFPLSILFTRFLHTFNKFKNFKEWVLPFLYAIFLFIAIKCSDACNPWFSRGFGKPAPIFSIETLIHYFNSIFLPVFPLICILFLGLKNKKLIIRPLILFLFESIVFFSLGFVLGAVDQFNYFYLDFFFFVPWLLELSSKNHLRFGSLCSIVLCNLLLLLPMIATNSSHASIHRSLAIAPIDNCAHNQNLSWQTHVGIMLGMNIQPDYELRKTVLDVFLNGANNAQPPIKRIGNIAYYIAFLYEYGYGIQGKNILFQTIDHYPYIISCFFSALKWHVPNNRNLLLTDIKSYAITKNEFKFAYEIQQMQLLEQNNNYLDHSMKIIPLF